MGDYSEGSTPKHEACDRSVLSRVPWRNVPRRCQTRARPLHAAEAKIEPAPLPSRPVLLPDDLVSCLRQLADADLERLQSAVVNEVARRGLPKPPLGRVSDPSDEQERRVRTSAAPKPASPGVTAGKANAIRAAFRAGLKPATIARQFGVTQSVVRQVLQAEGRS